jgi:hypothetical protein
MLWAAASGRPVQSHAASIAVNPSAISAGAVQLSPQKIQKYSNRFVRHASATSSRSDYWRNLMSGRACDLKQSLWGFRSHRLSSES